MARPAPAAAQPPAEATAAGLAPASIQAPGAERGSVSSALSELVVDGPVGPAVDLDDLLSMLMKQFEAGGWCHCSPDSTVHAILQ